MNSLETITLVNRDFRYIYSQIYSLSLKRTNDIALKSIIEINGTEYFVISTGYIENDFIYLHKKEPGLIVLKPFSELLDLDLIGDYYIFNQNCLIGIGDKIGQL